MYAVVRAFVSLAISATTTAIMIISAIIMSIYILGLVTDLLRGVIVTIP